MRLSDAHEKRSAPASAGALRFQTDMPNGIKP
jgi:hypothetical protein